MTPVSGSRINRFMKSARTAAARLDAIVPQYPMSVEHAAWIAQGCPWNRAAVCRGWVQIEIERNPR